MSVDPVVQAALDAPLREIPSLEAAELGFLRARPAGEGWSPFSLFGVQLARRIDRRRAEREAEPA